MSEIEALIDQLAGDPANVSVLAVLGDLLQREGDPRGELIAMQLGIGATTVEGAVAIARRREALIEQLTPVVPEAIAAWSRDRFRWGIGYVRSFDLGMHHGASPRDLLGTADGRSTIHAALAELWAHPSMRILSEAVATHSYNVATLAVHPPPKIRSLVIGRGAPDDVKASPTLLAGVPRLERLCLHSDLELAELAHPTVTRIELEHWTGFYPLDLSTERLPAVRSLAIHASGLDFDPVEAYTDLARHGWLARLDRLAIHGLAAVSLAETRALADGLAGRRLPTLDVGPQPIPRAVGAALAACCDSLVGTVEDAVPTWAEHAAKPEWGRGAIVRAFDGKLEIVFPNGGRKVFKADAVFLRLGSE